MAVGNYTVFRAKHVTGFKFGSTAWTEANLTSTVTALDTSFATNNTTLLINLVGAADAVNPTKSYAFAKDVSITGNERSVSEENLLGADTSGAQNQELKIDPNSKLEFEATVVYRNTVPMTIFNDTTRACLIEMDNSEATGTGKLNIAMNNLIVTHVGSLTRNADGLMEQKVKGTCRGGTTGTTITVTQTTPASETWAKIRAGTDYCEEIRTA